VTKWKLSLQLRWPKKTSFPEKGKLYFYKLGILDPKSYKARTHRRLDHRRDDPRESLPVPTAHWSKCASIAKLNKTKVYLYIYLLFIEQSSYSHVSLLCFCYFLTFFFFSFLSFHRRYRSSYRAGWITALQRQRALGQVYGAFAPYNFWRVFNSLPPRFYNLYVNS